MQRLTFLLACLLLACTGIAQIEKAPERKEGEGPYDQLIIRGVTLINSTGAPPLGPVDIVVEKNRITQVVNVGVPGVTINESKRPKLNPGGKELQAEGMFLLPGFVDMHGHIGGKEQGTPAEYVFKLWMAHGITTIRDPLSGNGLDWTLDQKKKSEQNLITAPRIKAYTNFGMGSKTPISTAEQAREWVRDNAKKGSDGIKFFGASPEVMLAALQENKRLGLRSACHHAQLNVGRWNALNSAYAGLTTMEHWYGLPEAMFENQTIQNYQPDYNYANEQDRFGEAGKLWQQAAKRGSDKWNKLMDTLIKLDFTIDPTFVAYEANRDLMRAMNLEWHKEYTLPSVWKFYHPSRTAHGSYWHSWGSTQEINWKQNYRLWMDFVNDYKNKGGRVTVGTDAAFIYNLYGFDYPREMELLQEAGFHPLEVIKAATLNGAQALGMENLIGSVEVGKLADFVILDQNPLLDFKVLYGIGAIRLTEDNKVVRVGGVKYTIKDGIIYDAKKLLADVKKMVADEKAKTGFKITIPGAE
ncbi:amidohydrolase [Segetibacter sp. 3557_3]|uniref:amidohydrolase family protein n=1 Tax=Segetibacter sp. 3557_3 TaxID=2547429 RepID=UPI0010584E09|nr:amidohydrolase family protein [Segetibacter sp. 3557_3]TDH26596.1 amidohydrolase [Segetibacter sp. 3557_3]